MKAIVLILLAAIVISLVAGLFFLIRGDKSSPRMLTALKIRVGLSVVLVTFLVLAFTLGWINP
jgi:hypothetical protein